MKVIPSKIANYTTILTGLLLVFIGSRFLLTPLEAEAGFGIHVPVNGIYSFHYIKGIRDLSVGLLLVLLCLAKEWRSLGLTMLCIMMVPLTDFLIVFTSPGHRTSSIFPHLIAVVITLVLGFYYLFITRKPDKQAANQYQRTAVQQY
jgi:hypothetical protein